VRPEEMVNAWYTVHKALAKRPWWSLALLVLLFAGMTYVTVHLPLEEDITKLIPVKEGEQNLQRVLRTVRFTDKIVVNVALQENGEEGDLITYADRFLDSLHARCEPFVEAVQGQVGSDDMARTMAYVQDNLPQFLDDADYQKLAGVIRHDSLEAINERNFRTLISPSGLIAKDIIRQDPFGLTFDGLSKLKEMGVGDALTLHDGYLLSKDHRNLLLFITPKISSDKTAENDVFVNTLYAINSGLNNAYQGKASAEYFGSVLIAVANAERIKADVRNSMIIAVVLLLALLLFFFRRTSVSIILFVPSLFGGLLGICVLYFLRDGVSAISLGIGSVVLGCTLDYSLHILTHLRERGSVQDVYREVASPILVSSLTTACAFLCLIFLRSQALQDLGVFCAMAVLAAAVFALVFIPLAYRPGKKEIAKETLLDRIAAFPYHSSRWSLGGLAVLLIFSCFTYSKVHFDNDLSKMNYMPADQQRAEDDLDSISDLATQSIHVVAFAPHLQEALQVNDKVFKDLQELQDKKLIKGFSSIATVLHSNQERARRTERWNSFWTTSRKDTVEHGLIALGNAVGLKPATYQPFFDRLDHAAVDSVSNPMATIGALDPADFISGQDGFWTVASIVRVERDGMAAVRARFAGMPHVLTLDRQHTMESFLKDLKTDFNKLVLYSFFVVVLILFAYFRSGTLVLVTALPIVLTWLITIGFMGLVGMHLNIFNIMICTFIFGMGIDYSIFITRGLLLQLSTGIDHVRTHKTSIVLSVITTLLGVGVLVFAKHPALYSISIVAIIGIVAAMLVSFTVQPWLFRLFVGGPERRPVRLRMLLHSMLSFTYFGLGGLVLSLCVSFLLPIIPVSKKVKMAWFHRSISAFKKSVLYSNPFVRKQVLNPQGETFERPAIMVANHTSFLDILAMGMLHPKVIFLVNDWVHDSPIFGKVVQLAGGYPVSRGIENGLEHLREKMRQGYSLMVFPEGTRSRNLGLRRFHKGAFYLAHQFKMDIVPVLIHGNSEVLPKGTFVIRDGRIDISILPRIAHGSPEFGTDARDTTKRISVAFKKEFLKLRRSTEGPTYFHKEVLDEYRYRAPARFRALKRLLKKQAEAYHGLMVKIPLDATVLHLSRRGGHLDLCLALDGPNRKLRTFIGHEGDRAVVMNGVIDHTHDHIAVLMSKEEAMLQEADIALVEEGVLTPDELALLQARFPDNLFLHA